MLVAPEDHPSIKGKTANSNIISNAALCTAVSDRILITNKRRSMYFQPLRLTIMAEINITTAE